MRIEYKILWVEDEKSWYETTKDLFTDILDELGFSLVSKKCENIEEVRNELIINKLKDYDLLLIDYTLKNNETGEKIIEFIRNIKDHPILTDVLFYSSAVENVRDSMHKLGLEGVYTADRRDIMPKFELVVNTTIKKVQDLNNMRGLIMAETSDIDKKMLEIINFILEHDFGKLKELLTKTIYNNVNSKIIEKKEKFDRFNGKRIEKIISDNLIFDASEKLKAVQFIFNNLDHPSTMNLKNEKFTTSYIDISKKRNLLGHETQNISEGKIIIGFGESAFEFNDDFCVDIRKKIRKHSLELDSFLEGINPKNN